MKDRFHGKGILRFWWLVCLPLVTVSPVGADEYSLWQRVSDAGFAEHLALVPLSQPTGTRQAISIDGGLFETLQGGDTLSVTFSTGQETTFTLDSPTVFLNGDRGWRGSHQDADQLSTLSLTHSARLLMATLSTPGGRYFIRALPTGPGQAYVGWLYTLPDSVKPMPIDDGPYLGEGFPSRTETMEVSSGDLTIVQTVTPDIVAVGEEVSISVAITNNLATPLSGEEFQVLFTPQVSDLVSSNASCELGLPSFQQPIVCTMPTIPAQGTINIDYVLRMRDNAYPQVNNAVFIGDLVGDHVRSDSFIFVTRDTLTDSDNDGLSDFNESIADTDPNDPASVPGSQSQVDLLFLYTQRFLDDLELPFPESEINQIVQVTNGYFADSNVDVVFRPVYYGFTEYNVASDLNTAMDALSDASAPSLSHVPALRDSLGADIVVLVDGKFQAGSSFCGLGISGGNGLKGEIYHPAIFNSELYITLYKDGFPDGGGAGCDDDTLAHELGHNFGVGHSRRDASSSGTFDWSHGYGVDGFFTTIMARESDYSGTSRANLFADPSSSNCSGMPCGVSRGEVDGADAVHTLNHSRFQIAARRQSRLISTASLSASTSDLIMFGGASRNGDTSTLVRDFAATDSIDVSATLAIPTEHQGQVGLTYVVIVVDGLGLFYRDPQGNYLAWDGESTTLQGYIAARPLLASEELEAFGNFVPADFGVTEASLTVFFAYSVQGTDVFMYSANGVPVTIGQ